MHQMLQNLEDSLGSVLNFPCQIIAFRSACTTQVLLESCKMRCLCQLETFRGHPSIAMGEKGLHSYS